MMTTVAVPTPILTLIIIHNHMRAEVSSVKASVELDGMTDVMIVPVSSSVCGDSPVMVPVTVDVRLLNGNNLLRVKLITRVENVELDVVRLVVKTFIVGKDFLVWVNVLVVLTIVVIRLVFSSVVSSEYVADVSKAQSDLIFII